MTYPGPGTWQVQASPQLRLRAHRDQVLARALALLGATRPGQGQGEDLPKPSGNLEAHRGQEQHEREQP